VKAVLDKTTILVGDAADWLPQLPDESVNCVVTSPPYFLLRDYNIDGQIGLESTLDEYLKKLTEIFEMVKRVLRRDGTLWLNVGDCYVGPRGRGGKGDEQGQKKRITISPSITQLKKKDLIGIPWRLAFALQKRGTRKGWYLRSDIVWNKSDALPSSVQDRPTKSHEYIFLFSRQPIYYFNQDAVREPALSARCPNPKGRNVRSVWTFPTAKFLGPHFATFPIELATRCILAGCPEDGVVFDPFFGAGTTGLVAEQLGRRCLGIELNPQSVSLAKKRIENEAGTKVRLIMPGQSLDNLHILPNR
jgi:DNA modification methylase